MSEYIILTGIGNRNIRYLNQGYKNDIIPREVFYDKTKFIWEHPSELQNVTPQILPPLLEEFPNSRLIMFTTHQDPPYQDTYYEGLILKEILENQYSDTKVETVEIKDINPTDSDSLIEWFKGRVRFLISQNPESKFIIYETGGTHQLKNALKSVCEFYLIDNSETNNHLITYQGIELGDSTKIQEVKKSSIEELNLLTNVKLLVNHNDYGGANLLGKEVFNKNASKLIEFSYLLWDGMWQDVNRNFPVQNFGKSLKNNLRFSLIENLTDSNNDGIDNDFNIYIRFFRVCRVLLSKSYNSALGNNFSGSVLTFHQFMEYFTSAYIESNSDYKLVSNRRRYEWDLLSFIKDNYEEDLINLLGDLPGFLSFPVQLIYAVDLAKNNSNETILGLFKNIQSTQSTFNKNQGKISLDTLRNGIAHNGKGVSESNFDIFKDFIFECHRLFNPQEDVFQSLNNFIFELI